MKHELHVRLFPRVQLSTWGEEMLNRNLLLFILTFSVVWSMPLATRFQNISLDFKNVTDISQASIHCYHLPVEKVLFFMQNGKIIQSLVSEQFKERVQCSYNRSERKVDLKLLNFTKDDAGEYLCNFHDVNGLRSVKVVLNCSETVDGNSGFTTPTPGPAATAGTTRPPERNVSWALIGLVVTVVVVVLVGLVAPVAQGFYKRRRPQQVRDQEQNGDALELQSLNGVASPPVIENGGGMVRRIDDYSNNVTMM